MSKIKFTAKYEIETSHALDSSKALAIIRSFNEGGELNMEEATLTGYTLVKAIMETPIEEEETVPENPEDETTAYEEEGHAV